MATADKTEAPLMTPSAVFVPACAAEAGCGGAIGTGTGFGARFLAFALLAGFAFFIPFFLRAGALRFALLDFFATFNLPNRINQIMQHDITP
jgi:hypothetical protein